MNEDLIKKMEDAGIQYMSPPQGNYNLVAQFNPVNKRSYQYNDNYATNVTKMASLVNNSHKSQFDQDIAGPNGQSISRHFSTPYNKTGQLQVQKFNELAKANEYFTYDIETLGDAMNRKNFSVSEIAIQGFRRSGNTFVPSNKSLTQVIAPSVDVQNNIVTLMDRLKIDPYQFNLLSDSEKRTLVDITRYSTLSEKGISPANFKLENNDLIDFSHNTLANKLFQDEKMINSRVIDNMQSVLRHAESGLINISEKYGIKANQAISSYNDFINANKDNYFVSYNGDSFDLPVLQSWGQIKGNSPVNQPKKHLDYYQVVQTAYSNPIDLHKSLGRDFSSNPLKTGMTKLQEFRSTLGFDLESAHSASHDIGTEGLGGVINHSIGTIKNKINASKTNIQAGFNYHEPGFSWSNQSLETGQTLFAVGGVRAKRDGDLSFSAKFDPETGSYNPINDSFNTTIINAKSFYEVEGLMDLSDNEMKRYGLRLYNKEKDMHSFIVREGNEAFDELAGFVQNRFYNWDGLTSNQRREINDAKLTDSARRRYERMFSLEKAGSGKTGGYEAARRLYGNAEILEKRLLGKHKHISGSNYQELIRNRITHEELMNQMEGKFNSLWDSNSKSWVHNPVEQEEFFRMGMRLISERPVYETALKYIGENLKDPAQRDMAWRLYSNKVNEAFPMQQEDISLQDFERKRISFTDYFSNTSHTLNMTNTESVEQSIKNYVYSRDISGSDLDKDLKEDRYRERMNRFIKNLNNNKVINNNIAGNLTDINNESSTVHNAIVQISDILQHSNIKFDQSVKQTSLGYNSAVQQLNNETNELMFREAVNTVKEVNATRFNPNDAPGTRVTFSSTVEKALSRLDETHLSGLQPNNRNALEKVVSNLIENDAYNKYHFAVSMDEHTKNARISIYNPSQSTSVIDHLSQGMNHPNAVTINMPLIGQNGIHTIGNRRLNARSFATYNNGNIGIKSSAEVLADNYTDKINYIMNPMLDGNAELANTRSRRVLNESVNQLSGIQRNLTNNDTFNYNNNQSDFFKQGNVDIENAMIQDWYQTGKLRQEDIFSNAFENGYLKKNVTFDNIKPRKSYEMLLASGEWLSQKNLDLYAGTNKADNVALGSFNKLDVRDYLPYGHFTFQGRDNSVQFMNAHLISPKVASDIQEATRDTNAFLRFDDLVTTEAQREWSNEWRKQAGGNHMGVNLKTAFMNDQQLLERLESIKETNPDLLKREGVINEDGSWNHTNIPTIYEQQGLVASDIQSKMRATEQKVLSETDNVNLFRNMQPGATVKPGQTLGTEIVEGNERPITYNGKHDATVIQQNGRIGVSWEEDVFKYIVEGEKATDVSISRDLMSAITGDDSVSMVLNANIQKHRDFGMYLSGKAKLLANHAQEISSELIKANTETHPNDKASSRALERMELQKQFDRTIRMASKVNLKWDDETQMFIQEGNKPIPAQRFNRIFNSLGINDKTELEFDTAILEARASKVSNYSTMTDEQGRKVLRLEHDKNGNVIKRYARTDIGFEHGGVNWGHREMGVLKDLKLDNTYNKVYETMMSQASNKTRLQETKNIIASITGAVDNQNQLLNNAPELEVENFRSLPSIDADMNTYKKTVFDKDYIHALTGGDNAHGYWLKLPSVEAPNGNSRKVALNLNGNTSERVAIDNIFIPFTNREETNGKVFLRDLQKKIGDIYKRADDVQRAGSIEARNTAMDSLQASVDDYFRQATKDVTSSKGQTGKEVLRAGMNTSGNGLFKLMDPKVSMDLDGEFTFISPDDAKAMGVYEDLAKRASGEIDGDLFVMNTRYPTFHSNAMQIAKLRMSDDVKSGEFRTTSWMSDLMKADSDGDYDNIVVMKDKEVQKEWESRYNEQEARRQKAYEKQINKDSRSARSYDPNYILKGQDRFAPFQPNTQEELASKIGKRVIGQASNLNLTLRQMAFEYLDHGSSEQRAVLDFGQDLEQKPISSKHGLTVEEGRAPAIELVNSIYRGNWSKTREIQQRYFADDFDTEMMEKAFSAIDKVKGNMENGLYNKSYKFGTSSGLDPEIGLKNITDIINGSAPNEQRTMGNTYLNMIHQMLGVDASKEYIDLEGNVHSRVNPYESMEAKRREPRSTTLAGATGEYANDLTGNVSESIGRKVQEFFEAMSENKKLRWGVIGSGLALGALGGYNILRHSEPINDPTETDGHYEINQPQPALNMESNAFQGTQNADIQIQAKGNSVTQDQLSHLVNEGITNSNMSPSQSRISINYSDNTNQLNRIWYRDKVEESI
ncbi:hypothetical protein [Virgibacillus salexigens]|uniref:Uncharacterized protein n=1 Tax=Virgibacillus massiliensis TaxID=1462526 RepID=A0A024QHS6_9BACI|nr:hypothetical protein [Virgibacillus massiliensis]CDQ41807.1 hypothetical protein BN990_04184 [Virgibacillus massiliensis]